MYIYLLLSAFRNSVNTSTYSVYGDFWNSNYYAFRESWKIPEVSPLPIGSLLIVDLIIVDVFIVDPPIVDVVIVALVIVEHLSTQTTPSHHDRGLRHHRARVDLGASCTVGQPAT